MHKAFCVVKPWWGISHIEEREGGKERERERMSEGVREREAQAGRQTKREGDNHIVNQWKASNQI